MAILFRLVMPGHRKKLILQALVILVIPIGAGVFVWYGANSELSRIGYNYWFPSNAPASYVNSNSTTSITVTINVRSLNSDSYFLTLNGQFRANKPPWVMLTTDCSVACAPGEGPTLSYKIPNEEPNTTYLFKYEISLGASLALLKEDPYSYPLDSYSTPVIYFGMNQTWSSNAFELQANVPSPLIASFESISYVPVDNLPRALQEYLSSFNGQYKDLLTNGYFVAFTISLIRPANDLIASSLYVVGPTMIFWEVCWLSIFSLKEQKDRLKIFVAVLFSVFAYYLTLRPILPVHPTYVEGVIASTLGVWIIGEACCLIWDQIWSQRTQQIISVFARVALALAFCGTASYGIFEFTRHGIYLFPWTDCTPPLTNGLPQDTLVNLYKISYCNGWIVQAFLILMLALLTIGIVVLLSVRSTIDLIRKHITVDMVPY
ncbi:MAG: hypothetical protein ACHQ03_07845 [Candidatus Bathyarchaeia archaeon]